MDCLEFFVRLGQRPPTQTCSTDAEWHLLPSRCPAEDNPYAATPGEEGTPATPALPKAGALLRPEAAAAGGASAPPTSSAPLTTT
eukprot:573991-Prorocentrum_lima.AAC.1